LWRKREKEGERKRQRKIRAQVSDTRMQGNVILPEESTGHDVIGNPDSFQLNVTLRINPRFLFSPCQQISQGNAIGDELWFANHLLDISISGHTGLSPNLRNFT